MPRSWGHGKKQEVHGPAYVRGGVATVPDVFLENCKEEALWGPQIHTLEFRVGKFLCVDFMAPRLIGPDVFNTAMRPFGS